MLIDHEWAATLAARRREMLEPELLALRVLRAEIACVRPGLLVERVEGWQSLAGDRYADLMRDLAGALADAETELERAEREAQAAVLALEEAEATARRLAMAPPTPHRPNPGAPWVG
ncbi:hypothetical protein [Agromyces marinus]|uniref:hypothetical protein n=1 Tax=Agromyces marinus TaxID=1389020 RepID=UPI001F34A75C|nr:hypothetical protein [Agromyces marinus]UIP60075.1 hypothetical protein DSM26151_29900 [Agromyces marinus]